MTTRHVQIAKAMLLALAMSTIASTGSAIGQRSALLAPSPLFIDAGPAKATAGGLALSALTAPRSAASWRRVRIDPATVSPSTKSLLLDLGYIRVHADVVDASATTGDTVVWRGRIRETGRDGSARAASAPDDTLNSIVLVRRGTNVTGTIRVDGMLFQVRPLGGDRHALVEVNERLMPAEHPRAIAAAAAATATVVTDGTKAATKPPVRQLQPVNINPLTTITVMVVATEAVRARSADLGGLIDLAVIESNQGFANSGVKIKLVLAGSYVTSYHESGSFNTDLDRLLDPHDGFMDEVHGLRDAVQADVTVLLIDNPSSCGLAPSIGSEPASAFVVVHWNCATGLYSFGHEIGHLLSARHDISTDARSTPDPDAHGFRVLPTTGDPGWRTIMALDCPTGCPRLNYWSNLTVKYNGQPMGWAGSSDNASVLNRHAARVSQYRGPPATTIY